MAGTDREAGTIYDTAFAPPLEIATRMRARLLSPILLFLALAGCMLAPHKIDIQQGNYVDQEMIDKLKPEMTRSQVKFILGTPLVSDPFHPNRWDYVFMTGTAGKVHAERKITVVFDGDKLLRVDGDVQTKEKLSQANGESRNP
jgi:outer membrane protein assembly factor BamE